MTRERARDRSSVRVAYDTVYVKTLDLNEATRRNLTKCNDLTSVLPEPDLLSVVSKIDRVR